MHTLPLLLQSQHSVMAAIHFVSLTLIPAQAHETGIQIAHAVSSLGQNQHVPRKSVNASVNKHKLTSFTASEVTILWLYRNVYYYYYYYRHK